MKGCDFSCTKFTCGSWRHHKGCINYPESMQEMVDNKNEEIKKLKSQVESLNSIAEQVEERFDKLMSVVKKVDKVALMRVTSLDELYKI